MSESAEPVVEFKPLMGTDEATIDDKGRLLVGKKKRDRLGKDFVFAISENGVLAAYPLETWRAVSAELGRVAPINLGRQIYARMIMGTAEDDMNFDQQGRVVIPLKLREASKLGDKVVLVGAYDRLEIWSPTQWEHYNNDPKVYGRVRLEAINEAMTMMREQ
jgi:MraZ protein